MDFLRSPLEALVFNYVSYGFLAAVQSFWTWVAVLTAAVSFWRIRTVRSLSLQCKSDTSLSFPDLKVDGSLPFEVLEPSEPSEEPSQACSLPSFFCAEKDDSRTKGKFTVYYEFNGSSDQSVFRGSWDDEVVDGVDGDWSAGEVYESLVGIRRGGLGWHSFQDLTMINGSIVRLWDCDRLRKAPSGCFLWQ